MLPKSSIENAEEMENEISDKAVRLDFENMKVGEIIEGKEALAQWIKIALMTQRYKFPVFSHSFGTDIEGALDEGYVKAIGIIKNEITESLMCHSKISAVRDFVFEQKGTKVIICFKVISDYGSTMIETEVG